MKMPFAILAALGGTLLGFVLCAVAALALRSTSYESMARRTYGSPEALSEIAQFYERVELASPNGAEFVELRTVSTSYPRTRRVPMSLVPSRFGGGPDVQNVPSVMGHPVWGDVLAYYDDSDRLAGIEFFGSRFGCFVSRSPTFGPPWFESLNRIATRPVYVSLRITGGD
jgi:hypothetical protein